jgi:hypothetical protein
MDPIQSLRIHLSQYLDKSRSKPIEPPQMPPNALEVANLIAYLRQKGLDPIIVGSVAMLLHLSKKRLQNNASAVESVHDIEIFLEVPHEPDYFENKYRLTKDVDFYISKNIPPPPSGWRKDRESIGVESWISPNDGFVDFLIKGQRFPHSLPTPQKIEKDPEFEKLGLPVASLQSLFALKLNSERVKDTEDLLNLAKQIGIPKFPENSLNPVQKENLNLIEIWMLHQRS